MDIATLQRLCARTWPGLEQHRLGEWELRAAGGFTGRANSALPLGDPGLPLPLALDQVVGWYAERGLVPRLQVPATLAGLQADDPARGLTDLCDARRWAAEPWTLVMLRDPAPTARCGVAGLELVWRDQPDDAWLNLYHPHGAQLPASARAVITAAPAHYLSARIDGVTVGIGRAAVAGPVVVLTAIEVLPRARRGGIGTVLTEALVERGADAGLRLSALQVFAHNTAAVALYQHLGFRAHHRYPYRYPSGC